MLVCFLDGLLGGCRCYPSSLKRKIKRRNEEKKKRDERPRKVFLKNRFLNEQLDDLEMSLKICFECKLL